MKDQFILTRLFYILLVIGASGCSPSGSVSYTPPVIPITITVDTSGDVSVSISKSFITPIGVFDIGSNVTLWSLRGEPTLQNRRLLVVGVDNTATVYEIEQGKGFKAEFSNTESGYRQVNIDYQPNGDIALELVSTSANFPPATVIGSDFPSPQPMSSSAPVTISPYISTPTEDNWRSFESIWQLTTFYDMNTPGIQKYDLWVNSNSSYRWSLSWCATDQVQLEEILKPLTVYMRVNGNIVQDSHILQHNSTKSNGWKCKYWSTILSNWPNNTVVELDIEYHLAVDIFDGSENYSSGEYHQTIMATSR